VLAVSLLLGACGGARSALPAREAEERGDLDGAIRGYREAFDAGGRSDPDLAIRIGRLALLRGDLVQAEAHLQAALHLRPGDPDASLGLARAAFAAGDNARALALLDPLAQASPVDPEVQAELARVTFARQDFASAAEHADLALKTAGAPQAELWMISGRALARTGRVDLAEEAFQKAIEVAPDDSMGYFYLGRLYDEINLPKRAVPMLQKALQLSPAFIDAARDLGTALLHDGDADQAAQVLENARALAPDDVGLLNNLGVAQREAGRMADARETFQAALAVGDGSRAVAVNLADTCLQMGDFAGAQAVLVGALRKNLARRDDVLELEKILVLRAYNDVVCARAGAFARDAFQVRLAELRREAALDAAEPPASVLAAVLADDRLKTLLDEANQRCPSTPK